MYVQSQWRSTIKVLDNEPGITILKDRRGWFKGEIKGLKDPLAPSPRQILKKSNLPTDSLQLEFEPYLSLSPDLVENLAQEKLLAPDTVKFNYDPTSLTLALRGQASTEWVDRAKQFIESQPRINRLELSGLQITELNKLRELTRQLEGTTFNFREGIITLNQQEVEQFEEISKLIKAITTLAEKERQSLIIRAKGQASTSGSFDDNVRLSQSRADLIVRRLVKSGVPSKYLKAEGIGERLKLEQSDILMAQVTFRVEMP